MTISIIHNIYDTMDQGFLHSITVEYSNGSREEGKRVGYKEIAVNGMYRATTAYYIDTFPAIFTVSLIKFTRLTYNNLPLRHSSYIPPVQS